ncbi:helix-turn-helix transcriptional regulator [Prosthecochloris sp. N3]|uniref:Helix-turn-helix transcriptional regulator n=1 Tax=Prosthecochloris ethylica TaxID=2743976 RepID=A0ABR9XRU2_9CHLB|nr:MULTISPECIES: metalloregulator ArsR/SmtB family transcription factor [Prosthecochloris]MEC9487240.1 metalloregulator ArsR/SmtB family transcription factor [Prosthecochloris sp.]MBF0586037.1 helix-turn-helix transcriptional regulator [Prosthecochloris ethylica]MBF0636563.1 helix-turn-helix transcriptional regulator [Prosthecochloris ethylica]NUK47195.1 helix-turn-helix transcriptional regulator [Prosthecochloris ethylica]RNA65727.1 transcriptional regulator [Prosthecochloris sp. ZM_2]
MQENRNDICDERCFHPETVAMVRRSIPQREELAAVADLFRAFGDRTRVTILSALHRSELCVCDLTSILDMNQSAVSHQLRVLRAAKIVKSRKDGKNVYYSLDDRHVSVLLETGLEHVNEGT